MKAFMTSGTIDLMEKIMDKNPSLTIHLMNGVNSTLAYYEDESKKIFSSGRSYEVIVQTGEIEEEGFVAMNHIPLTKEGMPVFEYRFKKRQDHLNLVPGFLAFRLLKPIKGNIYVVLTQWGSEEHYNVWTESDNFTKAHQNQKVKPPAYFTENPFATTYSMGDEEEEEEEEEEKLEEDNVDSDESIEK